MGGTWTQWKHNRQSLHDSTHRVQDRSPPTQYTLVVCTKIADSKEQLNHRAFASQHWSHRPQANKNDRRHHAHNNTENRRSFVISSYKQRESRALFIVDSHANATHTYLMRHTPGHSGNTTVRVCTTLHTGYRTAVHPRSTHCIQAPSICQISVTLAVLYLYRHRHEHRVCSCHRAEPASITSEHSLS